MAQTLIDPAVEVLQQRLLQLGPDATPEQLAYLGKAVESIGGRATVLDVMSTGTEQINLIKSEGSTQLDAITALAQGKTTDFTDLAAAKITALTQEGTEQVNLVKQEGSTQITAVRQEGQQQVAAVQNAGTALTDWLPVDDEGNPLPLADAVRSVIDPQLLVKSGTLPFIFGVVSRYGDGGNGYGAFTSQLGRFHNGQGLNKLRLITGYHGWSTAYRAFSTPPSLQFLTGSNGQFIYRNFNLRYAYQSNMYSYPRALLGVLFVRNTTDQDITRTLWFGGSSYWSSGYEGMGVTVLTPNGTNADPAAITSLSESNRWSYTSSNWGTGTNISIVVPASTTVAVLFYASSYYYSSTNNHYSFFEHFVLQNMRSFFGNGLEVDIERTIKAFTNPDGSADPVDIWH